MSLQDDIVAKLKDMCVSFKAAHYPVSDTYDIALPDIVHLVGSILKSKTVHSFAITPEDLKKVDPLTLENFMGKYTRTWNRGIVFFLDVTLEDLVRVTEEIKGADHAHVP